MRREDDTERDNEEKWLNTSRPLTKAGEKAGGLWPAREICRMAEYVKVPRDRIGALVGKEGRMKATLQKRCGVKLDIGKDGGVSIVSPDEDGLKEWKALDIVKAVGRGFNPKYAMVLLKEDRVLSIIDLEDILKHKESDVKRIKARIIGEGGRARKTLERLSNTKISVYGKTVSIIGSERGVQATEKGIQMILDGARHAAVYRFLEKGAELPPGSEGFLEKGAELPLSSEK